MRRNSSVSDGALNWFGINNPGASTSIDAEAFCSPQAAVRASPIDNYYTYALEIVMLSAQRDLEDNSPMTHLLLLGAVVATEQYFREILCGALCVCPISRRHAQGQRLSLGGLDYFGKEGIGFALLESCSLSTQGEIKKQIANLTGFEVKRDSAVAATLAEFEKVCQLRHAAIHSRGEFCNRNLSDLGLFPNGRVRLHLTQVKLQSVVSVCHSLVRTFNRFLFEQIVKRLIVKNLLIGDWANDQSVFEPVFKLFYSCQDCQSPSSAEAWHTQMGTLIRQIRENGDQG